MIMSWDDIQRLAPMNPMDLIANARFGATQGSFLNSANYISPGAWAPQRWLWATRLLFQHSPPTRS